MVNVEILTFVLAIVVALSPFAAVQFYVGFLPNKLGRIKDMGSIEEDSGALRWLPGRAGVPVRVECDDGSIVDAEMGFCDIRMQKIRVGSRVGVTKMGSRCIAMPLWLPTITERLKKMSGEE